MGVDDPPPPGFALPQIGDHEGAVGKYDIGFQQVVYREAVFSRKVTVPPAEGQSCDTRCGNDTGRDGKTERMCRVIHVTLGAARANPSR